MTALPPEKLEVLRKLAIAELWRRRAFWPLLEHYLDRDQLTDIRSLFEGVNPEKGELPKSGWWDEISRQRGKSYKWTTLAVVWCHCFPGQRVKYLAQLGTSVRGIIAPTIDSLIDDMPAQMRPSWRPQQGVLEWVDPNLGQIRIDRQDHKWHFPHPGGRESIIHAAGANNQHYRALRGEPAHWLFEDECAFYDDFEEVQAVLGPMTLTTGGVTVFATTPAESPEHPSKAVRDAHKADGRYVHRTLYDHPRLTTEQIEEFLLKEAKKRGMDLPTFKRSTYYRRELLCIWVAEETRAIVVEWSAVADEDKPEAGTWGERQTYEGEAFPEFFAYADALDIGFTRDPSGYIQAHWDFKEACLYVHAELPPMHRKRTDELAEAIKGCREQHVPASRPPPHVDAVRHASGGHWLPYLSVGDAGGNGAEKLAELAKHHDIHFVHAEKTDLESMVDELRVLIRQGKVKVHKRCKNLLAQLANGLWADKGKSDFERTPHHHNDHLIALVYLVRMLAGLRAFNPYPLFHGKDPANMIVAERRDSTGIQAVKSVLE
jgi:hypothetical protein